MHPRYPFLLVVSVDLEDLEHEAEALLPVILEIGVATGSEVAFLDQMEAVFFHLGNFLFGVINAEGDVVDALAPGVEKLLPGAVSSKGLHDFELDLPEVEEGHAEISPLGLSPKLHSRFLLWGTLMETEGLRLEEFSEEGGRAVAVADDQSDLTKTILIK